LHSLQTDDSDIRPFRELLLPSVESEKMTKFKFERAGNVQHIEEASASEGVCLRLISPARSSAARHKISACVAGLLQKVGRMSAVGDHKLAMLLDFPLH
jgi:hypothetical protein